MKISVTKRVNRESGCYDSSITLGLIGLGIVGLMAIGKHDNDIKTACKEAHEVERIAKASIPDFMNEVDKSTLSLDDENKIKTYADDKLKDVTKLSPDGKVFMREYYRFKAEMVQATRTGRFISVSGLKTGMPFISPVEMFDMLYQWHLREHINFSKTSALFCEDVSEERSSVLRMATEEFKLLNNAICKVLFSGSKDSTNLGKDVQNALKECKHVPVFKDLKPYKEGTEEESFICEQANVANENWIRDAELRSSANQIYDEVFNDLVRTDGGLIDVVNGQCADILLNTMINDSAELLNKFKDIKEYALEQIKKR